jgi:hypothetical protein
MTGGKIRLVGRDAGCRKEPEILSTCRAFGFFTGTAFVPAVVCELTIVKSLATMLEVFALLGMKIT